MEVFINCLAKPSRSGSADMCSKMTEWETMNRDEYRAYAEYLMSELRKKCKDEAISNLIRCFGHPEGLSFYEQREIENPGNDLKNLYLLMLFLDPRGLEAQGPVVPDADDLCVMREVLLKSVQMKMKNLMPNRCGGCRLWYAIPHGVVPEVLCAKCGRARHDCTPFAIQCNTTRCIWFCTNCGIDFTENIMKAHTLQKKETEDAEQLLASENWKSLGDSCTVKPPIDSDISSDEEFDISSDEEFDISSEEEHLMELEDYDTSASSDYESDSCDNFQTNFKNRLAKIQSDVVKQTIRKVDQFEKSSDNNIRENQDYQRCEKMQNDSSNVMDKDCVTSDEIVEAMKKINLEKVWCGRKNLTWCATIISKEALAVPLLSITSCIRKGIVPNNWCASRVMLLFKDI